MKKTVCALTISLFLLVLQAVAIAEDKAAPKQLTKIKLIWSDHIPATSGGNAWIKKYYVPRLQEQLAKVGYELDMTFYHAGTLYKSTEQVAACEQGLIDITVGVMSYEIGRAPLHEVLDFGFMGWDATTLNKVWTELNANSPELRAELAPFKEIFRFIPQPRLLHHNIKGARVPDDFKGRKIMAAGSGGEVFKAIGAVPVRQNPGDWYTSLDRGLLEGISVAFDMVGIMKLGEVLKYHMTWTGENFGHTPVTHLMNRKKFESLPKEVQKVFEDNFTWASDEITKDELSRVPGYMDVSKKKGNEFITLSAEETAKWRTAVKRVHEKWIADMEAKGKPAKKVYDEAVRLSKKYGPK